MNKRIFLAVFLLLKPCILRADENGREMEMNRTDEPIIMALPLRGEWLAPNTPGTKIPSHGTNRFGTRYAYDFIQTGGGGNRRAYRVSFFRYLLRGVNLADYYCYGADVYAPCGGTVVAAEDGFSERLRTRLFSDMANALKNAHYFNADTDDVRNIAGNYVIIRYADGIFAALCHLQPGSIRVSVGQEIEKGALIGNVGHSGNSFMPHLHFQLMDSSDIARANGLPCAFEEYERFEDGTWQTVRNGIPAATDRIRLLENEYLNRK